VGYSSIYKGSYNVSNVSFMKVLTMFQIYHLQKFLQCVKYILLEFHSFHCSLSSPPFPNSWNSINRFHFCIYIHVYILFAPYSPSYTFPHHLPPPTNANIPPSKQNLFCPRSYNWWLPFFLFWLFYFIFIYLFLIIHLFTCAYIVWVISPPLLPCPPLSPTQFQAGPVLPISLISLKKRHKPKEEDKAFLLVEFRIAI
jgi:hypothetical protein